MIEKQSIKIENNSNIGDIIVNLNDDKIYTSNFWINKGDICLKNFNWQGAFDCYSEALFFECTERQLYYCYKQMANLVTNDIEKKNYLVKIWNLKTVKKTKKDYILYFAISCKIFIEREPKLFIVLIMLFYVMIFKR